MKKLANLCIAKGFPCFLSVAIGDNMENQTPHTEYVTFATGMQLDKNIPITEPKYIKEMVSPASIGVTLAQDQIRKHLLVNIGFDVLDPNRKIEFNVDDEDE